ncbi:MAG: restriction endonuclease subunit S [Peptococcaceae bacterium]|jgi:type I restriction enzyme S subunit|nr:restriction endonuclease subunit S [Peptococcaceae bacterium]
MAELEMEIPEEFKETEIGLVPMDWKVVRLGDVVLKTKQTDPKKKPNWYFKYIDVSSISSGNLRVCGYLEYQGKDAPSRAKKLIKKGDVLFATVRPYLKRIAQIPSELDGHICSTAFCVIRGTLEIADSTFLYFITSTDNFVERVTAHQRGSSYPAVTDKDVLKELIPLPPLSEQRKIAHVLSLIQRAIELQDKVTAAVRELKKSLMRHLFTYGPVSVDQVGRVALKETEIGPVPEHWEVVRLGDVAVVKGSTTSPTSLGNCNEKGSNNIRLLYLKVSDMNLPGNDYMIVNSKEVLYINSKKIEEISLVPPSALIFPKRGAAICTNKKRLTSTYCLLDPNLLAVIPHEIQHLYLYYWFQGFDLLSIVDNSPIPQLNRKDVEPIQIPLPTTGEQQQISGILDFVDKKLMTEEKRKSTLQSLFQTMLHLLMTAQVRVKDLEVTVGETGF